MSLAIKAFFGYEPEPPITESPEPPAESNRERAHQAAQRSAMRARAGELARDATTWPGSTARSPRRG